MHAQPVSAFIFFFLEKLIMMALCYLAIVANLNVSGIELKVVSLVLVISIVKTPTDSINTHGLCQVLVT